MMRYTVGCLGKVQVHCVEARATIKYLSLNVNTSYQLGTTGWARYKAVLMHCQEVVVNVQHHMIFNDIFKNFTYKTGEAERSLVGCL